LIDGENVLLVQVGETLGRAVPKDDGLLGESVGLLALNVVGSAEGYLTDQATVLEVVGSDGQFSQTHQFFCVVHIVCFLVLLQLPCQRYSIESLLLDFQKFLRRLREFNLREVLDTEFKEPAGLDEVDEELERESLAGLTGYEPDIFREIVPEVPRVVRNLAFLEEAQMIPAPVAGDIVVVGVAVVSDIDLNLFHNC